jgi:hypothetical protein
MGEKYVKDLLPKNGHFVNARFNGAQLALQKALTFKGVD